MAKIVAGAGGSQATGGLEDTAYLKVFGSGYASQVPMTEPTTWDRTLTEFTGAILDRIRVRIDTGNTTGLPGEVDDIRIATDWASVVGVPEPGAAGLFGAAAIACAMRRRRRA